MSVNLNNQSVNNQQTPNNKTLKDKSKTKNKLHDESDQDFLKEIYSDQTLQENIKIHSFLLDIAIKVKKLREEKNISQRTLAEKIHSTQRTIFNMEKGKPTTTETLYKVFKALGVEPVVDYEGISDLKVA